eukprot:s1993_g2.t1
MIPGQCRHGRYAPGTNPKDKAASSAADPITDWKKVADREALDMVQLDNELDKEFSVKESRYLKKILIESVNNALGLLTEASNRKIDYTQWIDNPVANALFKEIFKEVMQVKAVKVLLRPFRKSSAEPHLSMASGYLRLFITGDVKHWKVLKIEDMREMSFSQINAAIDEDDWVLVLYGAELDSLPAPSTPSTRPRAIPAQPALPPRQDDAALVPVEPQPQIQERPDDEREQEALANPAYEEFEAHGRAALAPIKPNYNLRRVLERLPKLVDAGDMTTAKRLLVGLHERLWHTPAGDFCNLLRRAGLPQPVITLAAEAVQSCVVCRKFVRLPNRPQVRAGGATIFNETVQFDLFHLDDVTYMLLLDESVPEGQEAPQLLACMLQNWIQFFGPPARLVLDQQASLVSHESGAEFERMSIIRCPRGTTQGHGSEQHTGTGLVERHVQLMKLTMMKLKAELQRQGMNAEPSEVGMESALAHNQTLNFGGATPSMNVFGILPRGFYDPETPGLLSTAGSLQKDVTVFECAMRIRQTALAQTHQAIIEDRVARANRHRPHQLETDQLTAGVSEVEYYREVAGDPGWRGPALLLRLDQDEGVAVIQYQGKPYLVALRHIRPYHGMFHFEMVNDPVEYELNNLMKYVEHLSEYKAYVIGWIQKKNGTWTKTPKETPAITKAMEWADKISKAMTKKPLHGIIMGRALRTFKPPNNTTGKLVMWIQGGKNFSVQEHSNSNPLRMKKLSNYTREDLCIIYFYYYNLKEVINYEPKLKDKLSINLKPNDDGAEEMETEYVPKKRDEPEDPVLPESEKKKKQKMAMVKKDVKKVAMLRKDIEFLRNFYVNNDSNKIILDYSMEWKTGYDLMLPAVKNFMVQEYQHRQQQCGHLFTMAYKKTCEATACLRTAQIFKVDEETNNINEEDITPDLWHLVDTADRAEIKQFVDEKAFRKMDRNQFTAEMVIVDAIWVRKWKRYPTGELKVKSRLCARGCLDSQKALLTTRSTTATRLSQRLLLSHAARKKSRRLESIDIAGAFLKGFSFSEIQRALREAGVDAPNRIVVILPPLNVFRHLSDLSPDFKGMTDLQAMEYGLLCNKPVYGLNDAPLAWQLCLHQFVRQHKGRPSQLDDCTFSWSSQHPEEHEAESLATTHVDDIALSGDQSWLDHMHQLFLQRFGKVTRQTLPFVHCGCKYEKTPTGYKVSQREFASKPRPVPVPEREDTSKLTREEVSTFRSILGALLWLTATRLDIIADVSVLQAKVIVAEIQHLKQANDILIKVAEYIEVGLHYRMMEAKHTRLVCIHDASSAAQGRSYAQEGLLIGIMEDKFHDVALEAETEFQDGEGELGVENHSGIFHLLHASGSKAKRISYSTSHAETLSMVGGMEAATMIMVRLAELHLPAMPTIKQLIKIQEAGDQKIPMDFYGDCRDLFELITGQRTLPQDKSQRLYVLSLKEARVSGKLRMATLVPTEAMTADSLTKPMVHDCMLLLLTTGMVRFFNVPNHKVITRILPVSEEYTEHDLHKTDDELLDEVFQGIKQPKVSHGAVLLSLFSRKTLALLVATSVLSSGVAAQETEEIYVSDASAAMANGTIPNYANYYGVKKLLYKPLAPVKEEDVPEAMEVDQEGDPAAMAGRIADLKRKLNQEQATHRSAKNKIKDQSETLEETYEELREAHTEAVSWRGACETYCQQTNAAVADATNFKRDLADLQSAHDEIKEKYEKALDDQANLEEMVRKQRRRGDDLCDKLDEVQDKYQKSKDACALAARANASKDAKIAELQAALQAARQQPPAVRPSRAAAEVDVAELNKNLTDMAKKNDELKATCEQRAREILSLREQIRDAKAPPTAGGHFDEEDQPSTDALGLRRGNQDDAAAHCGVAAEAAKCELLATSTAGPDAKRRGFRNFSVSRESMEFDLLVVGAGPAGLAAAIRAKQRADALGQELNVCVVEKGEPGQSELLPDWKERGAPLDTPVTSDSFYWLPNEDLAVPMPNPLLHLAPELRQEGNYIISLGQLCRWLGEQAEGMGVEIYAGFSADAPVYAADGAVAGVQLRDVGIGKDGKEKDTFEPGMELLAKQTILAEGTTFTATRQREINIARCFRCAKVCKVHVLLQAVQSLERYKAKSNPQNSNIGNRANEGFEKRRRHSESPGCAMSIWILALVALASPASPVAQTAQTPPAPSGLLTENRTVPIQVSCAFDVSGVALSAGKLATSFYKGACVEDLQKDKLLQNPLDDFDSILPKLPRRLRGENSTVSALTGVGAFPLADLRSLQDLQSSHSKATTSVPLRTLPANQPQDLIAAHEKRQVKIADCVFDSGLSALFLGRGIMNTILAGQHSPCNEDEDFGDHLDWAKLCATQVVPIEDHLAVADAMHVSTDEQTTACLIQVSGITSVFMLVATLITAAVTACPVESAAVCGPEDEHEEHRDEDLADSIVA